MWLWGQSQPGHIVVLSAFHGLINWILLYGLFFVTVPAIRWLALMVINSKIESRNDKREKNALFLKNASPDLQKKIAQAAQFGASKRLEWKPDNQVVYSTDKDLLEQEFDK
jgi:H+/gluconate symporter-like permease